MLQSTSEKLFNDPLFINILSKLIKNPPRSINLDRFYCNSFIISSAHQLFALENIMLVNCTFDNNIIFSCLHRTMSKVDNCITKLGSPKKFTMGGTLPIMLGKAKPLYTICAIST